MATKNKNNFIQFIMNLFHLGIPDFQQVTRDNIMFCRRCKRTPSNCSCDHTNEDHSEDDPCIQCAESVECQCPYVTDGEPIGHLQSQYGSYTRPKPSRPYKLVHGWRFCEPCKRPIHQCAIEHAVNDPCVRCGQQANCGVCVYTFNT